MEPNKAFHARRPSRYELGPRRKRRRSVAQKGEALQDTCYRRYTYVPALIQLLTTRHLTLLDPQMWDDRNDSFFLSTYKTKKKLRSVLALCFTTAPETYHHWRVFAPGSSGVCVQFDISSLRQSMEKAGLQFKEVKYLNLKELSKKTPKISQLPFIKRSQFSPEKEVRAIWESETDDEDAFDVRIDLSSIKRITLSPWLHPSLRKSLVSAINHIDKCQDLKVVRSTLIENQRWKKFGSRAK